MSNNPRPSGDLEHLFRQTFAEAEIQPRTNLWEQLDHELVVQQNDSYRRRLVVHRWVAAACLLLALGFGGWAALWQLNKGKAGQIASSDARSGNAASGLGTGASTEGRAAQAGPEGSTTELATTGAQPNAAGETSGLLATGPLGQSEAYTSAAGAADNMYAAAGATAAAREQAYQAGHLGSYAATSYPKDYSRSGSAAEGGINYGFASQGQYGAATASDQLMGLSYLTSRLRSSLGLGLPDTLKPSLLAQPAPAASQLAAVTAPEPEEREAPKLWHRLRVGGTYAASAYNPNINFSQADSKLKADALTLALNSYYREDAETEYRRNLRAGLAQRVALTVDYAINKKWSVGSGVEVAEQRAKSATSYGFIDGKQVRSSDLVLFSSAMRAPTAQVARTTSYRYRSASVPVMVRYGSSKPGASLYAKVGAAVNVLLNSHSELEGSPAVTRTYTLSSQDSPYRKVMTTVRGGAGVRYQPATAKWSMAVGPVAEAGLTTLNAHPNQATLHQSRPYSIGLEATVEFGTTRPVVALH
ncbi:outer membrane beta-barrel protein [Hymenobacter wooponensis]|nr:outer membrane beta-barrel protein [Hymenobacter wooponensis]